MVVVFDEDPATVRNKGALLTRASEALIERCEVAAGNVYARRLTPATVTRNLLHNIDVVQLLNRGGDEDAVTLRLLGFRQFLASMRVRPERSAACVRRGMDDCLREYQQQFVKPGPDMEMLAENTDQQLRQRAAKNGKGAEAANADRDRLLALNAASARKTVPMPDSSQYDNSVTLQEFADKQLHGDNASAYHADADLGPAEGAGPADGLGVRRTVPLAVVVEADLLASNESDLDRQYAQNGAPRWANAVFLRSCVSDGVRRHDVPAQDALRYAWVCTVMRSGDAELRRNCAALMFAQLRAFAEEPDAVVGLVDMRAEQPYGDNSSVSDFLEKPDTVVKRLAQLCIPAVGKHAGAPTAAPRRRASRIARAACAPWACGAYTCCGWRASRARSWI